MATYKISDLLKCLNSMKKDGYEYVEVYEFEPDPNDPADEGLTASLTIDALESYNESESDSVDSVTLPDGYICHPLW